MATRVQTPSFLDLKKIAVRPSIGHDTQAVTIDGEAGILLCLLQQMVELLFGMRGIRGCLLECADAKFERTDQIPAGLRRRPARYKLLDAQIFSKCHDAAFEPTARKSEFR